jgi:hypothetical protein
LRDYVHLAVVGNFIVADSDEDNSSIHKEPPRAIIPVYVPTREVNTHISQYPFSSTRISIPSVYDTVFLDAELVFDCDVKYYNGSIIHITPKRFTVMNNAQINRISAKKWSENLNWGANSKGIATNWIEIRDFGISRTNLESYNVVSYLKRGGHIEAYTKDTKIIDYSFLETNLISWVVDQINNQSENDKIENIKSLLKDASYPNRLLLSLGATPTTPLGEEIFLEDGDELFMVIYNRERYKSDSIKAYLLAYRTRNVNYENMAILHQTAYLSE